MSDNPMIEQVNRIIGNLLAGGGSVALPDVGTLYAEQHAARRITKRKIQMPYRSVSFTSQMRGEILPDLIDRAIRDAAALRGEAAPEFDPQAIYARWLEQVYVANVLTISGVGILKFKNFVLDSAFEKRINPQGRALMMLRSARRFDWVMWVGSVTILGVLIYGGYEYLSTRDVVDSAFEVTEEVAPLPESVAPVAAIPADTLHVAVDTVKTESVAAAPQPQTGSAVAIDEPRRMESGMRYVVLGVFSSVKNAQRAAKNAAEKSEQLRQCVVYYFGDKYIVSPFSNIDAERCTQFILDNSEAYPGMWTYTAR